MREVFLILRTRLKIANNYTASIREHLWIHLFVFLAVVFFILAGGTSFFSFLFHFLHRQEEFGDILMNRLVGMVILAFFSMLIFSNLIISLSTTYISREIEFYMSQPVRHGTVFFVKLFESAVYSSWAFAILSMPFFVSYGKVWEASPWFYVAMPALVLPFLLIPAGIGALLVMVLTAVLPARRALKWSLGFVILAAVVVIGFVRFSGAYRALRSINVENFTQILTLLKTGSTLWLPHTWLTRGVLALVRSDWREAGYWFLLLLSTSLMLLQICAWLAPRLYYRGWCLAKDFRSGDTPADGSIPVGQRFFAWLERRMAFLPQKTRALMLKDMKTFWRDPAQWSQLIILFGLIFLYIAHLRSGFYKTTAFHIFIPKWQVVLSYFNMGATCFILSILTTRFVYPLLSLEGKQFWSVGLAPMKRSRVVWQKFWLCWVASLVLTEGLMVFSNWILQVPGYMMWVSCITIFMLAGGLTSLSVGLGAATPNFREDNPARIANGLGGTLNVILSLLYVGITIGLQAVPVFYLTTGRWRLDGPVRFYLVSTVALLLVVQAVAVFVPMYVGLRRWNQMEF